MKLIKSCVSCLLFITLFTLISTSADAATNRYWIAIDDGTTKYWSDNANWSNAQGGSGGYSAPLNTNYKVFFNDAGADVTVDQSTIKLNKITIKHDYDGTIDLNGNELNPQQGYAQYSGTLLVSENSYFKVQGKAAYMYGGTIEAQGNNSKIYIDHNFIFYTGSTVIAPGSGTNRFIVRGGFRNEGGTFTHSSGTVTMSTKSGWGEAMVKVTGTGAFYNIDFRGNVHKKLHTDIEVENNLEIRGNGDLRGNGKNITVKGYWWQQNNKNNFSHGNSTVIFSGSSAQTIKSGATVNC